MTLTNKRLNQLHEGIDNCTVCGKFLPSLIKPTGIQRGLNSASIMLIGIAPSDNAIKSKKAFDGHSFTNLKKWFGSAGYPTENENLRRHLYLTSILKCGVEKGSLNIRKKMWARCQEFLWKQLKIVQPKLVLILGKEPLNFIFKLRGHKVTDLLDKTWTTKEVFEPSLFPDVEIDCNWIVIPHPSGLNRIMNSEQHRSRVISNLKKNLTLINFGV